MPSQAKAPAIVVNMRRAYKSTPSLPANSAGSRMPPEMVPATSPPTREPKNSHTAPTTMACRTVSALEPTLVPSAFDTSCAPIAHAMSSATTPLAIKRASSMVRKGLASGATACARRRTRS